MTALKLLPLVMLAGCPEQTSPSSVSLPQASASTSSATPASGPDPTPWPDTARVTSADGSFALLYPHGTFPSAKAHGDVVDVASTVSEPGMGEGDKNHFYGIALTKLRGSLIDALRTAVDADSFHKAFPDARATEASFHASPGFFERERGDGGATGYHISTGVEGVGDEIHVFQTGDGERWRFDCNYCCGLVTPPPTISRDDQVKLCGTVLSAFQVEHARR